MSDKAEDGGDTGSKRGSRRKSKRDSARVDPSSLPSSLPSESSKSGKSASRPSGKGSAKGSAKGSKGSGKGGGILKSSRRHGSTGSRRGSKRASTIGKSEKMNQDEVLKDYRKKLTKVADNSKHTFRVQIDSLVLPGGNWVNPRLRFTLGGNTDPTDSDENGKLRVIPGGSRFSTSKVKVKSGMEIQFPEKFDRELKRKYNDLSLENLKIELIDKKYNCLGWSKDVILGEAHVDLIRLANGNVGQTIDIEHITVDNTGVNRRKVTTITGNFYFEEYWHYRMTFYDWHGKDLIAADTSGTSDPYLVFRFQPSLRKLHRWGGYFGRSARTETIMNTLNPTWEGDVGKLEFYGTRSDLENAEFEIRVFDWDPLSRNDRIGRAKLPFRGVLDDGFLRANLGLSKSQEKKNKDKHGYVEGYLRVDELPYCRQFGGSVRLLPGFTYLCVHIEGASRLVSKDASMQADPYFTVEWGRMSQRTKIVFRSLSPQFNETLYLPVRLPSLDAESLAKIGDVTLNCWDWDESDGADFLGSATITLNAITTSDEDAVEVTGVAVDSKPRSRCFSHDHLKLDGAGMKNSGSQVSVRAWFWPDLPKTIVVPKPDPALKSDTLPDSLAERAAKVQELAKPVIGEDEEDLFAVAQRDENGYLHFLPTYLHPMEPSSDFTLPQEILRMVNSITFAKDSEAFSGAADVWTSPNFFLDMKKGDQEEHAILLCNMFLGLKKDAYVVVGKTTAGEGHAWVMTRESNGNVLFYETTLNKIYTLEGHWAGRVYAGEEEALEALAAADEAKVGTSIMKSRGRSAKHATKKKPKPPGKSEKDLVFYDDDEVITAEEIVRDRDDGAQLVKRLSSTRPTVLRGGASSAAESPLPYAKVTVVFNHTNLWINTQTLRPDLAHYDLENQNQWISFIDDPKAYGKIKPFYRPRAIPGRLPDGRLERMREAVVKELEHGYKTYRRSLALETKLVGGKAGKRLIVVLRGFLEAKEREKAGRATSAEVAHWESLLTAAVPKGSHFRGAYSTFAYTDPRRIRQFLMDKYDFDDETHAGARFAFAVAVTPYRNAVVNVGVYVAVMTPKEEKPK